MTPRLSGDTMSRRLRASITRLPGAVRGVAMLEFALLLPIFVVMCVGGTELANYITTKMRISQLALQIADNAARMGTGSVLAAKTITESDIADLFQGAQIQSSGLDLRSNGRVILSDLEPVANPNTTDRYKIGWQRCYGTKTAHASTFGTAGQTNLTGMGPGPATRQTKAQDGNATMFVEVYYIYKPVINLTWAPTTMFVEIASMSVRDRRDLTGPPSNTAGIPVATC